MLWNPDGAALQCMTYPAQESLLRSLRDDRRATDSDQWFDRILSLQHLPEPVTPLCENRQPKPRADAVEQECSIVVTENGSAGVRIATCTRL